MPKMTYSDLSKKTGLNITSLMTIVRRNDIKPDYIPAKCGNIVRPIFDSKQIKQIFKEAKKVKAIKKKAKWQNFTRGKRPDWDEDFRNGW